MGTVKRWDSAKGFGFIVPDDGSEDVFIHASNIADGNAVNEGGRVCFRVAFNQRSGKATGLYLE